MNILTNLVKKYLTLNKRRTIVTIISIILSCALIGGVANLIVSFQGLMQKSEIAMNGNYHAVYKSIPIDKVKYIENNSYIKESMKSTNLGYSYLDGAINPDKPYLYITAYDKSKFNNSSIKLLEGRLPKNSNEILISNLIESTNKYKVGDYITLGIGKRNSNGKELGQNDPYFNYVVNDINTVDKVYNQVEKIDLKYTNEYKIVGIIDTSFIDPYTSPAYTVITFYDNKIITDKVDIGVVTKNPKGIFEKLPEIAEKADIEPTIEYHDALLRWYGVTDNDNANKILYSFALILIVIIMIASIIVIYNSFNISITERKKQFGMLSSIGTTSKQIRNMVLKEGLILSLIGIPLGILSGIVGIGVTLEFINSLNLFSDAYNTSFDLVVSPLAILATIFFGGLTIFLSSLIPAIKASKTSPIDAIRLTSDIKIKGKKLKTSKLTRKLFGIEGELAAKNMKRNRKKYRSTIISLFVSIVLFMGVNGFAEYTFRSSLKVYGNYNFNVYISSTSDSFYQSVSKLNNIKRYSTVKKVEIYTYLDESLLNKKVLKDLKNNNYDKNTGKYKITVALAALGNNEFNKYIKENNQDIEDYTNINNPKIVLLGENNYYSNSDGKYYQIELANLKTGDTLDLTNDANINSKMKVGKISTIYPTGFSNDSTMSLSLEGFISDELYNSLDNSLKDDNNKMMLINSSNPTKLTKEIKKLAEASNISIDIQNIDDSIKMMENAILAISVFLYGFIILVSLITVTNVINTITTSIYLRRREFAMLKAIGMTDKSFNKMIRYESIFYGLRSLIYGLPVGIFLDYLFYKNVKSIFVYDYALPIRPILICVVFVFFIISVTMIYSVNKIKKDNIIDVIKEENI